MMNLKFRMSEVRFFKVNRRKLHSFGLCVFSSIRGLEFRSVFGKMFEGLMFGFGTSNLAARFGLGLRFGIFKFVSSL